MKKIIQVVLFVVIIVLGYVLYSSIQKPIEFNKERDKRFNAAIEKLKDIREAEVAYKSVHGEYAGRFDTLINFLKTDSFTVERVKGEIPDSLDKAEALKEGLISLESTKVPIKDSIFSSNYPVDSLPFVPYTKGDSFRLGAGEVMTGSDVKVQVFEAAVPNEVLLQGLDEQLIINLSNKYKRRTGYPGLRVGSLNKATNNAGNWDY